MGDDGQLAAIERGGLFRDIAKLAGAVEIKEVRRQGQNWAREATEALARGDLEEAISAYDDRKLTSLGLELVDKSDGKLDFDLGKIKLAELIEGSGDHKISPLGVNDIFDENKARLIYYKRVDPREHAFADLRSDLAAAEIMRNEAAQKIARERGTMRDVKLHLSTARRSFAKDFAKSHRYLTRAAKLVTGYGRGM